MKIAATLLVIGTALVAAPAFAQPTAAQQDTIRSACRSDFLSLCAGVPRGGKEALDCLRNNAAKLAAGCRTAVTAITPAAPAAPPPAAAAPAAPPAAAAKPEPAPAPAPAAAAPAIPPATAAPAPAAQPAAEKPAAAVAPKPATAAAPAAPKPPAPARPAPGTAAAPAPSAPAAPAAAPATPSRQPTLNELQRVQRTCMADIDLHCKGVRPGGGRILDCLTAKEPALLPVCKEAVRQARR